MPFKPYARLMNIIGDQLITDKKVAVIEIIKNCYDADAKSVKVRFGNMNNVGFHDLPVEEQAYIEIEDDGCGMSLEVIENVWLRPATPNKIEKKRNNITKTPKGRIIQGEKGIGRFAIHKLGERVELYSKAQDQYEVKLEMNFSDFNPENQNLFNQSADYKLLEEVSNNLYVNHPPERVMSQSGTIIRMYNLRESWSKRDFDELYKNIQRLMPPVDKNAESLGIDFVSDFNIDLYKENKLYICEEVMTFNDVIERAQYTMIGTISENGVLRFKYKSTAPLRSFDSTINLSDNDELMANNYSLVGSKWFTENSRTPKCGSFSFTFYAFNLAKPDKTILNEDLKKFIKEPKGNSKQIFNNGATSRHILASFPFIEEQFNTIALIEFCSAFKNKSKHEIEGCRTLFKLNSPYIHQLRQRFIAFMGRYGVPAIPDSLKSYHLKPSSQGQS